MIDWISSKVAMSLAALLLLAGVVSFFVAQQAQARHDALQAIADRAAALIDEVSRNPGEFVASMSLGTGGSLALPRLAMDRPYALTLYRAYVVAGTDGDRAFAVLRTPIHLWAPTAGDRNASEVDRQDALHPSLTIESGGSVGGSVIVSRRLLSVDGLQVLETFVFD